MREEFEKWCTNQCNYTLSKTADGNYRSMRTNLAFKVWTASRAAIEIEFPLGAVKNDERLKVETSVEGAFNYCYHLCWQAITSHGIRIKGKTE